MDARSSQVCHPGPGGRRHEGAVEGIATALEGRPAPADRADRDRAGLGPEPAGQVPGRLAGSSGPAWRDLPADPVHARLDRAPPPSLSGSGWHRAARRPGTSLPGRLPHVALSGLLPGAALPLLGGVGATLVGPAVGRRGRGLGHRVTTRAQRQEADRLLARWAQWRSW